MAKKTVKGFGSLTYKHADGTYRTAAYNETIDVHADDVARLTDAGAFNEDAILDAPKASAQDEPDDGVKPIETARKRA